MAESDYSPEKWIWTSDDLETMGWHDVYIHAIAFQSRILSFDIDYMLKWVNPAVGETYYKFWMSPATLVFYDAADVHISLKPEPDGCPIIADVIRSESPGRAPWLWQFLCLKGEIAFQASGYRQFLRRRPVLASSQFFSETERGGISFSQITPEDPGA